MATNSEKLLDLSVTISDYEFTTFDKVKDIVEPLNIDQVFIKNIDTFSFQDFVIRFPAKTLTVTVTLWGGGSSGIKPSFQSTIATGGYSSGTIVRFPIEIKNGDQSFFALTRIGKGGEGFPISELVKSYNGEFSNFELFRGETGDIPNNYKVEKLRSSARLIEGLSSFGGGVNLDGSIIQGNSTFTYFSFDGANPSNTSPKGVTGSVNDDRNFYAPYLSIYDGYNSFIGLGGQHNFNSDADPNSGAGGAGTMSSSLRNFVGKGGNGGCILEYEGSEKIEIFGIGYFYIDSRSNFITFLIMDSNLNETERKIIIQPGVYSLSYLFEVIKKSLLEYADVKITQEDSNLIIKMGYQWSISLDSDKTSYDLLVDLGIKTSDLIKDNEKIIPPFVNNYFTIKFSGFINDACPFTYFESNSIYA